MASSAATSVPAEAERFPCKGAVQEVVTCDRLHNRERQSLSQVSQLASKLSLDNPGLLCKSNYVVARWLFLHSWCQNWYKLNNLILAVKVPGLSNNYSNIRVQ